MGERQKRRRFTTEFEAEGDEHLGLGVVDQMLADDQPGLDTLAEPHLVRQQVALDGIAKYAPDRRNLMRHEVDAGREQRSQSLRRAGQGAQWRKRRLAAIVKELAFGAPGSEDLCRIFRRVPGSHEEIDLNDVALPAVGKAYLIGDQTILLLEIVCDASYPHPF